MWNLKEIKMVNVDSGGLLAIGSESKGPRAEKDIHLGRRAKFWQPAARMVTIVMSKPM